MTNLAPRDVNVWPAPALGPRQHYNVIQTQ